VQVLLLGSAAGGGFPQWNCRCPCCRIARSDPSRAKPRTQSSLAVSADGQRWFLLNASPDVREQPGRLQAPPPSAARHVPIEGVVLTDAELDHTLGLALLRETRHLPLDATAAVASILNCDSRILAVTRRFSEIPVAASLIEMTAAALMRQRIAAFPEHYAWVKSEGLDYFHNRVSQAPRDSQQWLRLVQAHCTTVDAQRRAFEALAFHLELLWVMIDTIHRAYREP
jgi:coenzyme PQQ biosynthesis protein B